MQFKVGDKVEIAIEPDEFEKIATECSCDRKFIEKLLARESICVYKTYSSNQDFILKDASDVISNFFKQEWFKLANNELSKSEKF